jgi:hypothetical protein
MANEANIIRIKRSGTAGTPSSLKLGELAYSYLASTGNPDNNGGDRLFIGAGGVNGSGNANDILVIGGKYFTDLLDHARGTLTASSALIVDSDKKLDELLVDNLSLNGNTLSTTNSNLNVILSANGTGLVQINTSSNSFTLPTTRTSVNGYVLTANTDGTTSWAQASSSVSLKAGTGTGDSGTDATFSLINDDIEFRGDAKAITTALSVTSGGGHNHYVVTTSARLASTSVTGVASFSSSTFDVSILGDVSVKTGGISNTQLANSSFYIGTTSISLGAASGSTTSLAVNISGNAATATSATTASTADKVAHALTLGTNLSYATGTDFDGSAAREIDLASDLTGITSISAASGNSVTLNNGTDDLVFNADGDLVLPSYTLPNTGGSAGQVLTWPATGASGVLEWAQPASSLSLKAGTGTGDTGTDATISLINDSFKIKGDSAAITTALTVTGTTNKAYTLDISARKASTSVTGVASFSSNSFDVSAGGEVTVKTSGISNSQLSNSTISGVSLGGSLNDLTFAATGGVALNATYNGSAAKTIDYSSVGAAPKAGSSDITTVGTLTSGSIGTGFTAIPNSALANSKVTVGTTDINLGSSSTTLAGLTQVDVNNIRVTGNTISSTNTDGDIVFDPNGTGTINVSSAKITNLADPTSAQDAATKAYVDATRSGLDVKDSVRAATTSNITLTNTQTVDGVALAVGNRVLVKNQDTASENGIYVVASGAWTRATDADNSPAGEVTSGMFAFVEQGTVNADSGWVLTTDGAITLDTTGLTFVQFSGAGQITAGAGLSKTGNTLDVNVANGIEISGDNVQLASSVAGDGLVYDAGVLYIVGQSNRISVSANKIDISENYVGQTSITTLGTVGTGTWNAGVITYAYGGTGQSTWAKGDLLYASASNTLSKLAAGTNGQMLQLQDGLPVWADLDGGTYGP